MKKMILILTLLLGGYTLQAQNDTLILFSNKNYKLIDSTNTTTNVIKRMDSLYYSDPVNNRVLNVKVFVNNRLEFMKTFIRKEEPIIEKISLD